MADGDARLLKGRRQRSREPAGLGFEGLGEESERKASPGLALAQVRSTDLSTYASHPPDILGWVMMGGWMVFALV